MISYKFKNKDLLDQALTHKSATHEFGYSNNERLEFFGDTVLDMIIAQFLFEKYPNAKEGDLSKTKASVVCQATLAKIASQHELKIRTGKNVTINDNLISSAFEALVGAIYLDGGLTCARNFVLDSVGPYLGEKEWAVDYKTTLQEIVQSKHNVTPSYFSIDSRGPDHSKQFCCSVAWNEISYSAWGNSKKEAEQKAAKIALKNLENP